MTLFRFAPEEVAIVTGGATGIGLATCEILAGEGLNVISLDTSDSSRSGADAAWASVDCDIRDETRVSRVIDDICREYGRVDMLVNNAAMSGIRVEAPLLEHSTELFRDVMETNVTAQFVMLREVARAMISRDIDGRIVNIASIRGVLGGERIAAYSASKAGVIGLTRSCALELAPHGIRVNAVAPGFIATESALRELDQVRPWKFEKKRPLDRAGTPDEVARVVGCLLSRDSGFVTGVCYLIDGGVSTY